MEKYKEDLRTQIRDSYGKLTYTYTCFHKKMNRLDTWNRRISIIQIVLSAITTFGLIGVVISNSKCTEILSLFISAILLGLNLYTRSFKLNDESNSYRKAADKLWILREQYVSLLTDIEQISVDEVVIRRDDLQLKVSKVYEESPKTDNKSYTEAQKALKSEEEQFFTDEELDKMLPKHLRITK